MPRGLSASSIDILRFLRGMSAPSMDDERDTRVIGTPPTVIVKYNDRCTKEILDILVLGIITK